jgi:hypothetical protein
MNNEQRHCPQVSPCLISREKLSHLLWHFKTEKGWENVPWNGPVSITSGGLYDSRVEKYLVNNS